MYDMHELIHKYIEGRLSQGEEDQLWMNVLHKPLWYDYFITEVTAQKILKPSERSVQIDEEILNKIPAILQEQMAPRS